MSLAAHSRRRTPARPTLVADGDLQAQGPALPAQARLALALRERSRLAALRAALPMQQLAAADAVQQRRAEAVVRYDRAFEYRAALDGRSVRRLVGRKDDDEQAEERARRDAAIQDAADELSALDRELAARSGDDASERLRAEYNELTTRLMRLEREAWNAIDAAVDEQVSAGPPWAEQELGARPDDAARARVWEIAVRSVIRVRLLIDPEGAVTGLGAAPTEAVYERLWREAREHVVVARRTLGPGLADAPALRRAP